MNRVITDLHEMCAKHMPTRCALLARAVVSAIIDAHRDVLLRCVLPDVSAFGLRTLFPGFALAMSSLAFDRAEFQFAESIL